MSNETSITALATDLFFDATCIANLQWHKAGDPFEVLNGLMDVLFRGLRLTSFTSDLFSAVVLLMMLLLGDIPVASGMVGKVLWLLHLLTVSVQFLLMWFSTLPVFLAIAVADALFRECMTPGPGGIKLAHAVVIPTITVQPAISIKFCIACIYLQAVFVDISVCCGSLKKGDAYWKVLRPSFIAFLLIVVFVSISTLLIVLMNSSSGFVISVCVSSVFLSFYLLMLVLRAFSVLVEGEVTAPWFLFLGMLIVPGAVGWLLSGSFLFSLLFFLPILCSFIAVTLGFHGLVWAIGKFVRKLGDSAQLIGRRNHYLSQLEEDDAKNDVSSKGKEKENQVESQTDKNARLEPEAGCVVSNTGMKMADVLDSMDWVSRLWEDVHKTKCFTRKVDTVPTMSCILFAMHALLVCGPVMVYGSLAASLIYSGQSQTAVLEALAVCYQLTYSFGEGTIAPRMLSFNFEDAWNSLERISNIEHLIEFDPAGIVQVPRDLNTLVFIVAGAKILVSGAAFLRAFNRIDSRSVAFHKAARYKSLTLDEVRQHVSETERHSDYVATTLVDGDKQVCMSPIDSQPICNSCIQSTSSFHHLEIHDDLDLRARGFGHIASLKRARGRGYATHDEHKESEVMPDAIPSRGNSTHDEQKESEAMADAIQSQIHVGGKVAFMRSSGEVVVASVTQVDVAERKCDLQFDGFVEGILCKHRKRSVSFARVSFNF